MTQERSEPNWTAFYARMNEIGPKMLKGVPRELSWWVAETAVETDRFFPFTQDLFYTYWHEPSIEPERGVSETLKQWAHNVRSALAEFVEACEPSERKRRSLLERIEKIVLNVRPELVKELVACAERPLVEAPEEAVPVERLPFELLPPGEAEMAELVAYFRRQALVGPRDASSAVVDEERLEMIRSLKPTKCYVGTEPWNGYVLFEFPFTDRVVLECPVEGNATYVLSGNWKRLARLSKKELRHGHPESVERIIHKNKENWLSRVRNCLLA